MAPMKEHVQTRTVEGICYELTFKRVRRLNLRVRPDGTVAVSAPCRTGVRAVDAFVSKHAEWVLQAKSRAVAAEPAQDTYSDAQCLAVFAPVFERMYPLVAQRAPRKPLLKVRFMKSRWGVCHVSRNYITLNKQLMDKPFEALEYVVLHELVHLLHPNHQAGFHQEMQALMPDYQKRRALLRER